MSVSKRTTIQVSQECKDALAALGGKNDTYEDIIWRLLNKVGDMDEQKNE